MSGEKCGVKVMTRMRLFNSREIGESESKKERLEPIIRMRGNTCAVLEVSTDGQGFRHEREREAFGFDEVFWSMPPEQGVSEVPIADQKYVYDRSGLIAMNAAFDGFNCCIFAYGQTGSGKTYSMLGAMPKDPGISPRICDDLFAKMKDVMQASPTTKCQVDCMFFEIYNEKVRDLYAKKSRPGQYDPVKIRQHPTKGVFVEGLLRKEVADTETAKGLIEKGTSERAMAETKMNKTSSRSHAVFQLQLSQMDALKGSMRVATINLVDLAGSEKIKKTEAEGMTLTEATNINKSLSTLRRVIDALIDASEGKKTIAPFRDSVLTYVLSDSLGGNSKTQMIATISPHVFNVEETVSTLRYALRAKAIVCNAKVNEEKSAAMMDAMRDEIMKLRKSLALGEVGPGGSGGGTQLPAEIQKEIEMREAELKNMETTQQGLEQALAEYKEKEAALQQQLSVVEVQKEELDRAKEAQKQERFAATFRSAHKIALDKALAQQQKIEIEKTKEKSEWLATKISILQQELVDKNEKSAHIEKERDRLVKETAELKAHSTEQIAALKRETEELKFSTNNQSKEIEAILHRARKLETEKVESEKRGERLKEGMVDLSQSIERQRTEKTQVVEDFETAFDVESHEREQMSRRKDKYKYLHLEEQFRASTLEAAMEAEAHNRSSISQTISAQLELLSEKDFLIESANRAAAEWKKKCEYFQRMAEKKKEDVCLLSEALREYQSTTTHWLNEHGMMKKEISRLRVAESPEAASPPRGSIGQVGSLRPVGSFSSPRPFSSPTANLIQSPLLPQKPHIMSTTSPGGTPAESIGK